MVGKVCGTGSYVPAHVMSNDDLARIVDTNDEWIRERTGIGRRHIIDGETTSYMAGQAAKKALEQSGIDPEEIDIILLATSSSETVYPSTQPSGDPYHQLAAQQNPPAAEVEMDIKTIEYLGIHRSQYPY